MKRRSFLQMVAGIVATIATPALASINPKPKQDEFQRFNFSQLYQMALDQGIDPTMISSFAREQLFKFKAANPETRIELVVDMYIISTNGTYRYPTDPQSYHIADRLIILEPGNLYKVVKDRTDFYRRLPYYLNF
ncbi:hypothetical protein SmphiM12_490 [Sinorhizobium phage phiM12]|uniref:Uncharacterized protein n=1 Tax=Sinorhizobium phage phiM12 TaxID=1357423 RepID=S5MW16_9CAUD|nr:hypothetical protein AB690_gp137 [Sinorhizobium phage phiM12]AGR48122.2 hypothetical protein SmphiM12_490 [Sinorhizobium phage phiM12]